MFDHSFGEVQPARVHWMQWPVEVAVNEPFLATIVYLGLCAHGSLEISQRTDTAVTFNARWVGVRPITETIACDPAGPFFYYKTLWAIPASGPPGSIPVRGTQDDQSHTTFGDINVVTTVVDHRTRAVGWGMVFRGQNNGCQWLRPGGWLSYGEFALRDTVADTLVQRSLWMDGYLERTDIPVCGDTIVFRTRQP